MEKVVFDGRVAGFRSRVSSETRLEARLAASPGIYYRASSTRPKYSETEKVLQLKLLNLLHRHYCLLLEPSAAPRCYGEYSTRALTKREVLPLTEH